MADDSDGDISEGALEDALIKQKRPRLGPEQEPLEALMKKQWDAKQDKLFQYPVAAKMSATKIDIPK